MKRIFGYLFAIVMASCLSVLSAWAQPKYIFYMIGDGMGVNQLFLTEMYLGEVEGKIARVPLCMTQFPYMGLATSYSSSNGITDSSAAGTCLASGSKTVNGRLGLDADLNHTNTVAEILHGEGWGVGVMTSVSIDHATPGAFYAQVKSRNDYYTIGTQLAESGFDFFGGATFYQPYDKHDATLPNVYDLCEKNDYVFCRGLNEFKQLQGQAKRVVLIQEHEYLNKETKGEGRIPYAIDRKSNDLTLPQITNAAIDYLLPRGRFFMMVEGGQIDWACHSNDAAATIHEVIDFDKAVQQAYNFYLEHPDETLIVVTADHETGGLALGNSNYTLNLKLLQYQKASASVVSERLKQMHAQKGKQLTFDEVKNLFRETLGLYGAVEVSKEEDAALQATYKLMMKNKVKDSKSLYVSLNALSDQAVRLLNQKSKAGWTTHSHSAAPVPVFAIGVGAENFEGVYDNSDIVKKIENIAKGK